MGLRQLIVLAIFFGAVPEALAADRQPGVFQRAISLITMRRMGLPGSPASTIPMRPPNEVPTESISTAPSAAIRAVMSLQYCGNT